MTLRREQILSMTRLSGQVERYHTWPTHQRQSVGEHTWQVIRIWSQIFGPPNSEELEYLLWHDGAELVTGDPPFPLKANNPKLKAEYDRLELAVLIDMGVTDELGCIVNPSALTKVRAKICDLIEMHEFGCVDHMMGNSFAVPIVVDTLTSVGQFGGKLTRSDWDAVMAYLANVKKWYQA